LQRLTTVSTVVPGVVRLAIVGKVNRRPERVSREDASSGRGGSWWMEPEFR
jgi:hypothetical protein